MPLIHKDYKQWNILSVIGRVTNARMNSEWPIYCYELEGQSPRWSWDLPSHFKNPKAIKDMQVAFDRTHRLGTWRLREGSNGLEEACREHAVAPPESAGAPTLSIMDAQDNIFAWFSSKGYTSDNPFVKAPAVSSDSPKRVLGEESRPKAPMKKKKMTTKKDSLPSAPLKSPEKAPEVESRSKASTKKNKKDSLSPLRATSPEAIDVSEEEKDGISSKERRVQERDSLKDQKDSLSPAQSPVPRRSKEDKEMAKMLEEANKVLQKYSNFVPPVEDRDSVYLATNSPASHRVSLLRDTSMQTSIVGLYRRQVGLARRMSPRTATYTPIYTRDSGESVLQHQVEWNEHDSKCFEVYLIKWTQTTADGNQELLQGFVVAEHLDQHVDYFPDIESFEQESRATMYKKKDAAARQKRNAAKEKELKEFQEHRERYLEEEAEELRLRSSIAK